MKPPDRPALTVAIALLETSLRDALVLAGARGLDRAIEGVGVYGASDFGAVRPGQLVLCSAYVLDRQRLSGLPRRLHVAGAAALGVKLGPVWSEMPAELVGAAESCGLPLLRLPEGRFESLVNPVLASIAERQADRLRRTEMLHAALVQGALSEQGLQGLVQTVAGALKRPAAVLAGDGRVLAASESLHLWRSDELLRRLGTIEQEVLELAGGRCLASPISAWGKRMGVLCVDSPPNDVPTRAVAAQAAVVAAMQLVSERHVEEVHRRFERELLDELIDRRLDAAEAESRAHDVGWPLHLPYVVGLVGQLTRGGEATEPRRASLPDAEIDGFARALRGAPLQARSFVRRQLLGVVVHLRPGEEPRAIGRLLGQSLGMGAAPPAGRGEVALALSRPTRAVHELADAYRQASLALALAPLDGAGGGQLHFDDLGSIRLLAQTKDLRRLVEIAEEALAPLGDPSDRQAQELRRTLAALLAHNMRVSAATTELFFHYNTVLGRLNRIRSCLEGRLDGVEARLTLSLAIDSLSLLRAERRG